jgi:septal ring factor EnvC (AmiA/AmiB activator)
MTFVGKLLVIIQLVLSICFMMLAGAVYTRHMTWMGRANDNQLTIDSGIADYARMETEKNDEAKALKADLARFETAAANAKAELRLAQNEIESQKIQIDTQKTELNTQQALATISGDEAKIRREEALSGRRINEQLNSALNDQNQRVRQLEDELFNQQVGAKSLADKYNGLLNTVATLRKVLVANKLDPDPNKYARKLAPPPLVTGRVLVTEKSGGGASRQFVEVSIGSDDGVTEGNILYVYRVGEQNKYLGQIRLELVNADRAVGVVVDRAKNGVIEKEDYVTTKL